MPHRRTKAEQEKLMREVEEAHRNPKPPPQMQTVIASCGHPTQLAADADPKWTQQEGVCWHCHQNSLVRKIICEFTNHLLTI